VNYILRKELGLLYIGIPGLYKAFFKKVKSLKEANATIIRKGTIHYTPRRAANITSLKVQNKIMSWSSLIT
jgi:hypothetical protein